MEKERLTEHNFHWLPKHKRGSRIPGDKKPIQIGKPESRTPLLWIASHYVDDFNRSLYLVNDSGEVLEKVIPSSGGFTTWDDDVHPVSSENKIVYENVQPGEAVKVDDIDIIVDSDYILSVSVQIESSSLGNFEFSTAGKKGGIGETILLWDSLETGKKVKKSR